MADKAQFRTLAQEGKMIANRIEEKLGQTGFLDAIKLASPWLLDEEDAGQVRDAVNEFKALTGLGPLREPLLDYLDWCVRVDDKLTEMRCRSDRRAKRFITLRKQFEKYLEKRVEGHIFVLSIREQVALLQSLASRCSRKVNSPSRKAGKKSRPPENTLRSFVIRKAVQGVIVCGIIALATLLLTWELLPTLWAFSGTLSGYAMGAVLETIYYYSDRETRKGKTIGYLLLIGYLMSFLLISSFYVTSIRGVLGFFTDITLTILLVITEIMVRWGSLRVWEEALRYAYGTLVLIVFIVAATILSGFIEQTVWVAISVLAALWTVCDRVRTPMKQ